jgi:hypothetical protein
VFAVLLGDDPTDAGAGRVGERAPNFEVTDLSGSTISRRHLAWEGRRRQLLERLVSAVCG